MLDRLSKPKVFLSHSKANVVFIERLYNDLRKCQIEPWLDSEEIRHGHAWLEAIFEDGLPTCDCILVYLTEESINSSMVKKEIDASIIQQLKNSNVSFLPYVSEASIRSRLRADMQAIQTPELNDRNYTDLLPRIVSEIWRSYLERKIDGAIKSEQVRRLEAELELERIKSKSGGSAFSESESADFQFITSKLDRFEQFEIEISLQEQVGEKQQVKWVIQSAERYEVNLLSIIPFISSARDYTFSAYDVSYILLENLFPKDESGNHKKIECNQYPDLSNELLMYGLLARTPSPPPQGNHEILSMMRGSSYELVFTEKMEKFKYWMAFNRKMPSKVITQTLSDNSE